ncbi:MAG: tripartite tricarboxylate transporter substrate-binding protein [Deltaproteobacteria bacterium]|nr:tripartite tricarboxylate transporter substrate-binding protein [Deltaproteobacteria bacterium]
MIKKLLLVTISSAVLASATQTFAAQPYFQGKTVTLQVGSGAGGRQDRIARTLSRYLNKHVAGNPLFVIQNKPGGQGIPAMLTLSKGPTDGSFMSMVISSYLEAPYFGAPGANYDPKTFVYVGSPSTGKQRNVLIVHRQAGIKTLDDLIKRESTLGALRVGHRSYLYGRLIAEVLDLKVRWVVGYDTPELYIAMERGEVQGRVNDASSMMTERADWFANREIIPLIAMTLPAELPPVDHPLFKDVPSIMKFAKTDVHKNIIEKINSTERLGGAMAFPPGTPESLRKIMEEGLQKVGKDPEFQKEWESVVLEGNTWEKMFDAKEVFQGVQQYTDWRPEILSTYKRLVHEAPK